MEKTKETWVLGTLAAAERVSSEITKIWTKDKTQLKVETSKAILMVKSNLTCPCTDFHKFLQTQPKLHMYTQK
ncbi:hypothetical protein EON73_05435 [bacterium]|nr:MAG: hypothetical protein EON73_05435 [bacterium]